MKKEELKAKLTKLLDLKGNYHDYSLDSKMRLNAVGNFEGITAALDLINQLDEPELPVIPRFVAEFIKERKNRKPLPIILYGALLEAKDIQELFDWVWKNGENHNAFAIAFITGKYEIKKEPEWTVKLDNGRYVDNFIESITGVEVELSHRLGCTAPIIFKDKSKAESVSLLVGGEVVEVTDNV